MRFYIFLLILFALALPAAAQTKLFLTPNKNAAPASPPQTAPSDPGLRSYAIPRDRSSGPAAPSARNYYQTKKTAPSRVASQAQALSAFSEKNTDVYQQALKIDPDLYDFTGRAPRNQQEVLMLAAAHDMDNATSLLEYQRKKEEAFARWSDQQRRNQEKAALIRGARAR